MDKRPLVCVIVYDGLPLFELGIATEVFGLPRPEFDHWYDYKIIAVEPGMLTATGGIRIEADYDLTALEEASLIIVPGWRGPEAPLPVGVGEALLAAHKRGARIASICSGVFMLAACGFLDGKRATTHWRHVGKLEKYYPEIETLPDVLYVDEGNILTSAGSAAGIDLCLHIVREDFGSDVANKVARRLVLPAHREGGQAQFIPRPVPKERGGKIAPLLDEVRLALDEQWTVDRMAQAAGLTPRTLLRRFQDSAGESPLAWVTSERVERAKELLETTKLGVNEIAEATGFGAPETLRHHFKRRVGTSPLQYRGSFSN